MKYINKCMEVNENKYICKEKERNRRREKEKEKEKLMHAGIGYRVISGAGGDVCLKGVRS